MQPSCPSGTATSLFMGSSTPWKSSTQFLNPPGSKRNPVPGITPPDEGVTPNVLHGLGSVNAGIWRGEGLPTNGQVTATEGLLTGQLPITKPLPSTQNYNQFNLGDRTDYVPLRENHNQFPANKGNNRPPGGGNSSNNGGGNPFGGGGNSPLGGGGPNYPSRGGNPPGGGGGGPPSNGGGGGNYFSGGVPLFPLGGELFTLPHLFLLDSYWTPGLLLDFTRTPANFILADHHTNLVSQSYWSPSKFLLESLGIADS